MQPEDPATGEDALVGEVFSDYVARLGPDGEPPDTDCYQRVRHGLRAVVVGELRRRGLWQSPPSFLGAMGARWNRDALGELVSDAYVFIFVRRLRGLRDQQKLKTNIRPMVIKNVRNFLTELQMKADPLGYRVFGRLRQAVEKNIQREEVFLLNARQAAKKPRLGNHSLLGFQPAPATATPRADLAEPVRAWNNELLPKLITAEGRAVPGQVQRLAEKVLTLKTTGVAAFYLGDLAAELKGDIRRRWDGVWLATFGEMGTEPSETDDRPVNVQLAHPRRGARLAAATSIDRKMRRNVDRSAAPAGKSARPVEPVDADPQHSPASTRRRTAAIVHRARTPTATHPRSGTPALGRLKPLVLACLHSDFRADSDEPPDDPTHDTASAHLRARRGRAMEVLAGQR